MTILVRLIQSAKAEFSISTTESDISTFVNPLHPEKADKSIL